MENNEVVKQKIPWGMGVILLITGFGAFSALVNAFRAPVYQLGPVLATGTLATIIQLIIGGLLALIFYGIIKRFRWARKLAIYWEALLMILPLINIISFFGNQSMYDSYYQKILPPEAYSLMTHTAISGILLFSLVPAWIFGIIIIVYLARKKDFFINNFKNMANENKSTTWVVIQILIREAIIMIPLCIILLIAMGSIVASMDITKENMMQKLLANPELTDQIQGLYMLAGLILIIISYFGVWWGCKYVCKRTLIDSKDYIKIGYWVSLIPALVLFEINSYMAGAAFILGVILTPWVIKKWLVKLQNQFRGHN